MRRLIAAATLLTLTLSPFVRVGAQGSTGVIAGTAMAPAGPLAGATVQVFDAQGWIVGSAATDSEGRFSIDDLPPGVFTVNLVDAFGGVIGTSSVTLTAGAMSVTLELSATAGAMAGAAAAAVGGGDLTTRAVIAGVGAAAAAIGAAARVVTSNDVSPSR